jgi:hypothetical protein
MTSRPPKTAARPPAAAAGSANRPSLAAPVADVGWGDVVAVSDALAEASRPVEPRVGDLLQHPSLGTLEVLDLDDARVEVRDRARSRRKLARAVLEFRLAGDRHGKRLLKVTVRRP